MSECSVVKEQMPMLLVEALDASERERAFRHLEGCAACESEWAASREVWARLGALPEVAVPDRLRERFYASIDKPSVATVVPFMRRRPARWLAQAAAVAVLVGGSYFAGVRQTSSPTGDIANLTGGAVPVSFPISERFVIPASQISPDIQGRPDIRNVRFINDADTRELGVTFDLTTQVTITGSPTDKSLVNLLSYVLQDRSYSTTSRSNAIEWVRNAYEGKETADPEIVKALANVLKHDSHEGVRIKAVDTLRSLPVGVAPEARAALLDALRNDPNPSVRIKAIEALAGLPPTSSSVDPATVETLRQKASQADENVFVRVKAAEALGQIDL
jgi:hypothetical protein